MCRFCFCELSKIQLSKKCAYKRNNLEHIVPWSTNSTFIDYHPSNILQPKSNGLPVIVHGKHLQSSEYRLLCPMYWSIIPYWFKDNLKEWKGFTHNARIENINESKIYSSSLSQGKRCIIVMEGFFELKKSNSHSAEVYYFHLPNNLLKAAGLFNMMKLKNGETIYTCSVITTASDNNMNKIHHRMPLILTDESIETWLDFENFSSKNAIAHIKANHQSNLKFYKTNKIGSRKLVNTKKNLASKSILNWLISGSEKGLKRKAED